MRRKTAGVFVLLVVVLTAGAQAAGQGAATKADPWLVKTSKVQFQSQKAADAPVSIDVAKKDWMALPSSGAVLLIVASRKGDAVVFVERSGLSQPLLPADITDLFAQIESDAIKEQQPKATDFQSKVLDSGDRRLVAVQYARPGVLGSERVRQYSFPVGTQLYRVTCVSAAGQFAAYDPVFAHMAASFAATQ